MFAPGSSQGVAQPPGSWPEPGSRGSAPGRSLAHNPAPGHTTDTSWDHLVAPPRTWTHLVAHRRLRPEWGAVGRMWLDLLGFFRGWVQDPAPPPFWHRGWASAFLDTSGTQLGHSFLLSGLEAAMNAQSEAFG